MENLDVLIVTEKLVKIVLMFGIKCKIALFVKKALNYTKEKHILPAKK